jgi:malonyl-CoA/methylmalonyl-CoA synthetase
MRVVQDKIANHVEHGGQDLLALPIFCEAAPVSPSDISIDDAADLDPGGPGFVILTSGTTGRHKGVVLPRRSLIPTYVAEPNSATISYRPCFWVGGATNLIAPMVTGKKVYALRPNTTAQELLDTFKKHRITWLTFSPWVMKAMKDLLTDDDGFLSEERRQEYATWFQHLTRFRCSSGMPGRETVQFWAYLTGRPLENIYAGTEFGGAISVGETHLNGLVRASLCDMNGRENSRTVLKDSIGFPVFNTVVKLTEGDHGELRVKSPFMMIRYVRKVFSVLRDLCRLTRFTLSSYVGDDKATQDAFDEEGFYKTGDLVDLRNGEYFMVGRMIDRKCREAPLSRKSLLTFRQKYSFTPFEFR